MTVSANGTGALGGIIEGCVSRAGQGVIEARQKLPTPGEQGGGSEGRLGAASSSDPAGIREAGW